MAPKLQTISIQESLLILSEPESCERHNVGCVYSRGNNERCSQCKAFNGEANRWWKYK